MATQISSEYAQLLKIARERNQALENAEKRGFVDPAMAGGGGAPPMDPMAAGGAPPMGPAGAPPMDPAAAGGMPPVGDPAAGLTEERVMQMIQQAVGGGAGGAGGMMAGKKKVDVNTEIYHIKKLLAIMMEHLGIEVPPTALLGDPAEDPQASPEEVANDPASAGASPESAIKPIEALQGASPQMAAAGGGNGKSAGLLSLAGEAAAKNRLLRLRHGQTNR